jgi:glycosyltransferase involved in cell wall biosynthesis
MVRGACVHSMKSGLAVIETHPIQYHAPVYREVEKLGIPVTVIYGSDSSIAGYKDREFGVRLAWDTDLLSGYSSLFLRRDGHGAVTTKANASLARVLQDLSPVAVLLVGYSPRFYQHAILQAMRLDRPLLLRAETTDHARKRAAIKNWVRDGLLRWLYRHCQALLYIGQRSREHYRRLGCAPNKLIFSPYCVDSSAFQPGEEARELQRIQCRDQLGLTEDDFVILFSGKLVSRKGPDVLVAALQHLEHKGSGSKRTAVIFLGDGEMQASLRQQARDIAQTSFAFVGFKNQHELSPYYHAADVLVLPSREGETWGLVVNEALHHGVPCIVSDQVGCAPDLVLRGETGEIFGAGNAQELAAALQRALGWIGTAAVRDRCRTRVAGYSVQAAARGIASAYERVVGHRVAGDSWR